MVKKLLQESLLMSITVIHKPLGKNSCAEENTDVSQASVLGEVLRKRNVHILRLKMLMLDFYNRKIIYTFCGINHGTIIRISQFYGYPHLNLFGYLRRRFSTEIILGRGEWIIQC